MLGGSLSAQSPDTAPVADARKPADWVNPLIGTARSCWIFFSACRPFGLVNLSPDTNPKGDWGAGYLYGKDTISCFSHLHGWQLAGLPVMPVTGGVDGHLGTDSYASKFSHEDEVVHPGYQKVVLKDYAITAELISTARVGFHRYTFPPGQEQRVILDTASPIMDCKITGSAIRPTQDNAGLDGSCTLSQTSRRPKPLTVYFAVRFNRPFSNLGGWKDWQTVHEKIAGSAGPNAGVFVDFPPNKDALLMKVALSYISIEGARRNLDAALPDWNYDQIVREPADEWDASPSLAARTRRRRSSTRTSGMRC